MPLKKGKSKKIVKDKFDALKKHNLIGRISRVEENKEQPMAIALSTVKKSKKKKKK